jgi:FkbM family methyltransferase
MDQAGLALTGFRRERGLLWPDYDRRCAEVTFSETDDAVPRLASWLGHRRVAVQAGGNCGQLVRQLAAGFEAVYTFEPDPRNFVALTVNTAHLANVYRYQAALGLMRGLRGMADGDDKFPGVNCGALYVSGEGRVPVLKVDDLGLPACDLLMLDVEGGELRALQSAEQTIAQHRPLAVIEDKGLGARFYGERPHAAEQWMVERHGYRRATRIKNDTVLVP